MIEKIRYKNHCIILCLEDDSTIKTLIPKTIGILKAYAEEMEWDINKIFRMPIDHKQLELKLIEVLKYYETTPKHRIILFVNTMNVFKNAETKFYTIYMKQIVNLVLNNNLKIYDYETRTLFEKNSNKELWKMLLGEKLLNLVSNVAIVNEFSGTFLEVIYRRINWDIDVFCTGSKYVCEFYNDLFPNESKWLKDVCRAHGKIENVIEYFRSMNPNIKVYYAKESSAKRWAYALSIYDTQTTKKILENKTRTEYHIKKVYER